MRFLLRYYVRQVLILLLYVDKLEHLCFRGGFKSLSAESALRLTLLACCKV